MRIAVVAGPYVSIPPERYGGTEQVIYHLIKGLLEAGHEPILIGTGDSTVDCPLIPIVKKAISFPKTKADLVKHNALVQAAEKRTRTVLRGLLNKVDLIHSHGFDLSPFQHFPNLTTIHNRVELEDLAYYQTHKNLFYVSISENQQVACPNLQYLGIAYNGEDPNDFPIVTEPEDYVCFLGRFDRDKNPHLALQLAINLGLKIKIAGKVDIDSNGYFEECVEPLLSNPLVEYLGELGSAEKIKLLSRAKCNLHPTGFREPFGLTVMEAAYCGTPTLAIARGSMPELIEEGRTGMLVEDFVEGYHQIEGCFNMDRLYIARRARMLFNYKTMTKQYLTVYEKLLEIFASQTDIEDIVKDLTGKARAELQAIWRQNQLAQ
jgi:glycosyltransferase involved in cell wall biosynthesis